MGVHAVQHLRPVLRLGAAGARVEGQNRVGGIVFAGQQGGEPLARHLLFHVLHALRAFVEEREIARFIGQFDQRQGIVVVFLQFAVGFDLAVDHRRTLGHLLGVFHVVPKAVRRRALLELRRFAL